MITIDEASKLLGVTSKTIRLWEKEGKITSFRTEGGHRRYVLSDIVLQQNNKIIDKNNLINIVEEIVESLNAVKTILKTLK